MGIPTDWLRSLPAPGLTRPVLLAGRMTTLGGLVKGFLQALRAEIVGG